MESKSFAKDDLSWWKNITSRNLLKEFEGSRLLAEILMLFEAVRSLFPTMLLENAHWKLQHLLAMDKTISLAVFRP